MPTIMTHAIVPLAVAVAAGRGVVPVKVAVAGAILAMLPDADVIGFKLGIAYADAWGHRGATHSLVFAALIGAILTALIRTEKRLIAFAFLALSTASHGLLDMATSGGLGVALLWPFEVTRHFWDWTPIRVSPIGLRNFLSERGVVTILSELKWVWLPSFLLAGIGWSARSVRKAY